MKIAENSKIRNSSFFDRGWFSGHTRSCRNKYGRKIHPGRSPTCQNGYVPGTRESRLRGMHVRVDSDGSGGRSRVQRPARRVCRGRRSVPTRGITGRRLRGLTESGRIGLVAGTRTSRPAGRRTLVLIGRGHRRRVPTCRARRGARHHAHGPCANAGSDGAAFSVQNGQQQQHSVRRAGWRSRGTPAAAASVLAFPTQFDR